MKFNDFQRIVTTAFPEVTQRQLDRFALMEQGYNDWNAKINVISRKDMDGLYDHHVLHSLAIARYLGTQKPFEYAEMTLENNGLRVLDLGTGGGFPGIPLAVLFPEVKFTLCDSIKKKTVVAQGIADLLGLENVEVVNARAESLGVRFDYVVSRAVASLTDFYPWVKGCYDRSILYLKGGDINEEIGMLMARERMQKVKIGTWPVDSWLEDEYFAGKFVVDIPTH
ncbi:MAG: 16S rRNA (guanine(527)-N(7))-methyltransferase RsmG [Bacteroidales bacterium]|nr:16S rRNA (guanine(527)-N(7))-methyltransferase RsmG [Candidatus Cryptobacteroides faecihippi]